VGGQRDIFKAGEEFGLGAHLAARIIKLFDGIIQVSSKNNKITVEIILPRYIK
jgi:nitrogen-specific signal transduction histidine kinase